MSLDTPKVVLVVDDEPAVRTAVVEMVRRSGYQVMEADSAESALGALASAHIDLVLTDLMMPGMSGWQLLDRIKESDTSIKVVIFTGYIDEQGEAILHDRQADGFLVKPVMLQKLRETLETLLTDDTISEDLLLGVTVIAVDDDSIALRLVEAALSPRGFATLPYTDPEEALAAAERDEPSLFLLDLRMPTMSGFDLYRKIQEIDSLRDVPVIIMTASSDRATVLEAISLGVAGFVVKPFDPEELAGKVTQVLTQRSRT